MGEGAAALAKIEVIRTENKNPLLSSAKFQIACDVKIRFAANRVQLTYLDHKRCDGRAEV